MKAEADKVIILAEGLAEKVRVCKLEEEIRVMECLKKEREASNSLYAAKIVEKITFGMIALILIAVLTAIMAVVIK